MMPENRVIIAGSREFTDQTKLNKVCRWIFKTARIPVSGTTIISGTCRGTDKMGEEYAREEGMAVARFPADWSRYGKMAGPRRNGEMARYAMKKGGKATGSVTGKTSYLINNDVESTSGKNKKAKELGVPIISEDEFLEMIGE